MKTLNPKIVYRKPKYLWILKLFFRNTTEDTVFTFSDTIYAPCYLPTHLVIHEETHVKQQGGKFGAIIWWILYILFPKYRYKQELEAYRKQWNSIKNSTETARMKMNLLHSIACDLSGPLYNRVKSFEEAREDILE